MPVMVARMATRLPCMFPRAPLCVSLRVLSCELSCVSSAGWEVDVASVVILVGFVLWWGLVVTL